MFCIAGTKWNFLPFRLTRWWPLHGVDPYYLTHKAQEIGYHPDVVLAGRRINDSMAEWFASKLVLEFASRKKAIIGADVLILGYTFKENCPDTRNTKVKDLSILISDYGMNVYIYDPIMDKSPAICSDNIQVLTDLQGDKCFDSVILAVAHSEFVDFSISTWLSLTSVNGIYLDLKGIIPRSLCPLRV